MNLFRNRDVGFIFEIVMFFKLINNKSLQNSYKQKLKA